MPPSIINRFYLLEVGLPYNQLAALMRPQRRPVWLDGWGADETPGLTIHAAAMPNPDGIAKSVAVIASAIEATPENIERVPSDNLFFYYQMLHWERSLHYYLDMGERLAASQVRAIDAYTFAPYQKASDIMTFVEDFDACLLPTRLWRHDQHMTVIIRYLLQSTSQEARERFKQGALRYRRRYPIYNAFHETITDFWVRWVSAFLDHLGRDRDIVELTNRIILACPGMSMIHDYFSREHLFSSQARHAVVAPDVRPYDFEPMTATPAMIGSSRPFKLPINTIYSSSPLRAQDITLSVAGASYQPEKKQTTGAA